MEIPRSIRYTFSSREKRRKMNERKEIIQKMFDTIIDYTPPQSGSSASPDLTMHALYRGTLLGWVAMGALRSDPVLTSGHSYHSEVVPVSTSFDYANLFPLGSQEKDPNIKRALRRVMKREGVHLGRKERRDLVSKLSKQITVQVDRKGIDFTKRDEENGKAVVRVPIANLTWWSAHKFVEHIGVNPVEIAQKLQNVQ